MRTRVKKLFVNAKELDQQVVTLMGWVKTNRAQAQFGF